MTSMRKRTMRGSVAARDALVKNIAIIIEVAEEDMNQTVTTSRDHHALLRQLFVEALVDRMLFDDEILLDWIGEEQDDDKPWNSTEDDATFTPTVADFRAFEEATRLVPKFATGDRVVDVKGRARGTVTGRDADNPTRVRVKWDELPESWAEVLNLGYALDQRDDK